MSRKLGEALARRAELQRRLGEVRDRLRVIALVQEGDKPAEDLESCARSTWPRFALASTSSRVNAGNLMSRFSLRQGGNCPEVACRQRL
jgi:hypothetical protein